MRKFIVILFCLAGITAIAQKNVEKAANETCDCLNKANPADNISEAEYQALITECIGGPGLSYYAKICKEYDMKADSSQESFEIVGQKIGAKLIENCPVFMKMALNVEAQKNNNVVATSTNKAAETEMPTGSITGTITAINKKDFYHISIQTANGKTESFIWMRYFEGSTAFENNPIAQVGKRATINYREMSCYSPEQGDYIVQREITGVVLED